MTGANKILTVSYGTFSCTLEGFEDSFDTMKEIAEYFRDLAADDRYFGAEPPTLDAEMLAKIASRNSTRQVEAKVNDLGVVLRPRDETIEEAEPAIPAAKEDAAPQTPVVEEVVEETAALHDYDDDADATLVVPSNEYDDAQDEALAKLVSEKSAPDTGVESVAAKLRRIRAVVSSKQAAAAAASMLADDFQEDDNAPIAEQVFGDAAFEDTAEDAELAKEDALDDGHVIEAEKSTEQSFEVEPEIVAQDEAPEVGEGDEEEILARDAEFEDEFEDEEDSEAIIPEVVSADDTGDSDGFEDLGDDDLDDFDDAIGYDVSLASVLEAVDSDDPDDAELEDETSLDNVFVDVAEEKIEAPVIEAAEDIPEEEDVVSPTPAHLLTAQLEEKASADEEDNSVEDAVLGVLGKTGLSADDKADLISKLADIESDKPEDPREPVSLERGIDMAVRADRTNRVLDNESGAQDEAAVSRLMDETDAKLNTSENTRRRSAISHLRAAVAATFADRKLDMGDNQDAADESEPYRSALADVVQPHEAKADEAKHAAPHQPAPLILVSEQRIDPEADDQDHALEESPLQEGAHKEAIATEESIIASSTSFAEFAEKMGATELPDLLEAAAAYTAYVEGRPFFARPQILRQVADFAGNEDFSREEGLRSFGQLLRQGKIVKIKRGQFEIAETTRFKPEARIAGE